MSKIFGTDGVRGIANTELTSELALKIGRAAAFVLTKNSKENPKILIGKDTRMSCDMLESAVISGICSAGVDVEILGTVPTPAVAHLVRKTGVEGGIMISASHNSFEFNGIKIFTKNGLKLSDEVENEIEDLIINYEKINLSANKIGRPNFYGHNRDAAINEYVEFIKGTSKKDLKGIKIAIDCANGASFLTAEKIFGELGAECTILNDKPNGININANCGSTFIEKLGDFVKKNKFDCGIAFDGDADRCLMVDENGKILDGDIILSVCAKYMHKNNFLKSNTFVGTIMSNMGLNEFAKNNNVGFVQTKVGDRYILEEMIKNGYNIGGEQSGHTIFLDFLPTGDGELTAVQFLNAIKSENKPVSYFNEIINKFPQILGEILIKPNQKGNLKNIKGLDILEKKLGENGRIVVRESGTEPKIRLMIEHKDAKIAREIFEEAKEIIEKGIM